MAVAERNKTAVGELDTTIDPEGVAESAGPYQGQAVELLVRVDRIDASRNHRRARPGDVAALDQLQANLKEHGLLQPIGVAVIGSRRELAKDEELLLMFGARRLAAATALGWDRIPARVFFVESDSKIEALRAVENLHRSDITAVEQAQAVDDVLTFYLKEHPPMKRADGIKYVAAQTGQTESWVRDHDYFGRLTERVRELALKTAIPAGHLRELAKVGSEDDQWELALGVVGNPPVDEALGFKSAGFASASYYREAYARFVLEVEVGTVRYQPIKELRKSIEQTQRKLGRVHWDLSLPVFKGKVEHRPCVGCPKNSATEPGLFGLDDAPEVKDATCGDAACYQAKTDAAAAGRDRLLKKFEGAEAVPDAASIGKALGTKAIVSAGLDAKRSRGFVQRAVKARLEPGKARSSSPGSSSGARALTAHEKALVKYSEAVRAWERSALSALDMASEADPGRRVAWVLMGSLDAFVGNATCRIRVPHVQAYGEPETGTPKMPGKMPAKVAALLKLAVAADWASAKALAASKVSAWAREVTPTPGVVGVLAAGWGAVVAEPPKWEDYKPKPAAKKKGTAKKKPKKKATKKAVAKEKETKTPAKKRRVLKKKVLGSSK